MSELRPQGHVPANRFELCSDSNAAEPPPSVLASPQIYPSRNQHKIFPMRFAFRLKPLACTGDCFRTATPLLGSDRRR
jgi:hypothetical protein